MQSSQHQRSLCLPAVITLVSLIAGPRHAVAAEAPNGVLDQQPAITTPVKLQYGFDTGKVYHYKVVAFFSGQIPKLSEPGSDAHIKAELYYSATVLKHDATGSTVAFAVEAENLSFLAKEPGTDGKSNPDDELPFPLPIAQVQGFLNVTAQLRPDGSIASITGGDNGPIKIDVGVDLRKLFVLMLPVVLPRDPVAPGAIWPFWEGFLGKKPGRTVYQGKLDSSRKDSGHVVFHISQSANSTVSDKIDKEGNSTAEAKLQVGSITGEVTASGAMDFTADATGTAAYAGRLATGSMQLSVILKRDMPDPDHPGMRIVEPITVRGRMQVQSQAGPPKADTLGVGGATAK